MTKYSFKSVFDGVKWQEDVELSLDDRGVVEAITPAKNIKACHNHLIPNFVNSHSHAFQYAMAGLTEVRNPSQPKDDFWSWRDTMYKLASFIDDQDFLNIAAYLYRRMLFSGYGTVVEFHYLHRSDLKSDLRRSRLLIEAAEKSGINLVLVPIFYHYGSFASPASAKQNMFTFDETSTFIRLVDELIQESSSNMISIGLGVHSLRAADHKQIDQILASLSPERPFHIHISEQIKEVEECKKHYGLPPIEWLLTEFDAHPAMNLVHATHANQRELELIAASGANVVICPSTEANLGDGVFPASDYVKLNGSWSIGSDSHILLNPFEELRSLEYSQRLRDQKRVILCDGSLYNSQYLYEAQLKGSVKSTGKKDGLHIEVGKKLNGIVLNERSPILIGKNTEKMLSSLIFSGDSQSIAMHFVMGKEKLVDYAHEGQINESYYRTINSLYERLNTI